MTDEHSREPLELLAIAAEGEDVAALLSAEMAVAVARIVTVHNPLEAAMVLQQHANRTLVVTPAMVEQVLEFRRLARERSVLDMLPIAVALVDPATQNITWNNNVFRRWCPDATKVTSHGFFAALGDPEVVGDDPSPFHSAKLRKRRVTTLIRTASKLYLQMEVNPILGEETGVKHYLVILQDVTESRVSSQKLKSLQEAGRELANLSASDIRSLSVEDRIELLKGKIIAYTEDILHYDKIEIRLLSHEEPGRLDPLLAVGLDDEAMQRVLYALPEHNGITGVVAHDGESVLIEDVTTDSRFLVGATGAKSSMTVPLMNLHQEVIGTFNVESVERGVFTKQDLEFLESFGRDVATAIHTFELLSLEQGDTALKSIEAIHGSVARPVNAILHQSVSLLARCRELAAPQDIISGLEETQKLARDIMVVIQRVGGRLAPSFAAPVAPQHQRPLLADRRILVVDADESVCIAVNSILFRYGCLVEFAANVPQALRMAAGTFYDVFLSDLRPGEESAYDLLMQLQQLLQISYVPLILMRGYGYDAGHVAVKAKQAGVIGFLAKPFILDQMLTNLEKVLTESQQRNGDRAPARRPQTMPSHTPTPSPSLAAGAKRREINLG